MISAQGNEGDMTMMFKTDKTCIAQMEVQRGVRMTAAALCCFAICALLALASLTTYAHAAVAGDASATKPVIIPIEQKYTTNTSGVQDEFEYCLDAVTGGAPLPAGASDGKYTFTMKGATQDQLYIDYAGAEYNKWFEYKIYQVQPAEDMAGFTLDAAEYNLEAILWGNDQTQVVASTTDETGAVTKPMELAWAVSYDSSNIDDDDTPTDPSQDDDDDDDETPDVTDDDDDEDVDDDDTPLSRLTHAVQTGDMSVIVPTLVLAMALVAAVMALVAFVRRRREDE